MKYHKWKPNEIRTIEAIVKINGLNQGCKLAANTFNVSEMAVRCQFNLSNNYLKFQS